MATACVLRPPPQPPSAAPSPGSAAAAGEPAKAAAAAARPKLLTLALVHEGGRVLLGRKKRGFGEGYYNGFGGKVEPGETVEGAAIREVVGLMTQLTVGPPYNAVA
eukprot:SM000245S08182  [mRNA]  locus=s245:67320:74880:+ [translate_table: standard]